MNPEFKRNLWQELSLQRVIAMPIILLAIFFVASQKFDLSIIPPVALTLMVLLLVVWGSGLAADAIFQEIREHTWDALRMTPLGPWAMGWGKLFGCTVFVWYGAFWCVLTILLISLRLHLNYQVVSFQVAYHLLVGLFAQAFALFTALLFQRISPIRSRARSVFIQIFAIVVSSLVFMMGNEQTNPVVLSWYNLGLSHEQFVIGSLIFFCLTLLFGIYRLLRLELQLHSFPWAWPLFLVIWIGYLWGFAPEMDNPKGFLKVLYIGVAYVTLLKGTFLSAFFTPKNIIYYFRWVNYFKEAKYKQALALTPPWILTGIMGLIILFPLVLFLQKIEFTTVSEPLWMIGFCISIFFFLLRDLGLMYYLTFNFHAKRAHLATIVYLIVLYTLVPMLVFLTPISKVWYPAIAPWAWGLEGITSHLQLFLTILLVFLQAMIAWGFVIMRWKAATKQLA